MHTHTYTTSDYIRYLSTHAHRVPSFSCCCCIQSTARFDGRDMHGPAAAAASLACAPGRVSLPALGCKAMTAPIAARLLTGRAQSRQRLASLVGQSVVRGQKGYWMSSSTIALGDGSRDVCARTRVVCPFLIFPRQRWCQHRTQQQQQRRGTVSCRFPVDRLSGTSSGDEQPSRKNRHHSRPFLRRRLPEVVSLSYHPHDQR